MIENVIKAAEELLESIQFDDHGMMVGHKWQGGNGGMISTNTIRKADELRRAINRYKNPPPPNRYRINS
jgi:hypothetical protein